MASVLGAALLLCMIKVVDCTRTTQTFWRHVDITDVAIGGHLTAVYASTATSCGNLCMGYPGCKSYGHNSVSHTCWLYDHLVVYTADGTSAPGTRYFWRLSPRCPTELGYTLEEGVCFKIHKQNMTKSEGQDFCGREGGTLFIADTKEKLALLHPRLDYYTMLGGSDAEEEGVWIWADGRRLDINSNLWSDGQPDNYQGEQDMLIVDLFSGRLDDCYTPARVHVACQIPLQ